MSDQDLVTMLTKPFKLTLLLASIFDDHEFELQVFLMTMNRNNLGGLGSFSRWLGSDNSCGNSSIVVTIVESIVLTTVVAIVQ